MAQTRFVAPTTLREASTVLLQPGARPMAGGTDLLVQLKSGRARPDIIVDLKRISGMVSVVERDGGFVIGGSTPGAMLAEHTRLAQMWPGVVEGACLIGSTQVQGRASLAGNLCNASPAADGVPALIAAGATCVVSGPEGTREVPVESIPAGPGKTHLEPGEFISEICLPARPARASDAYLRMIPRTEMDIAIAGAAVNLVLDADGVVLQACVAVGAVAPTAMAVAAAGQALIGTRLEPEALERMVEAVRAAARPISDKRSPADYRTRVVGVLAKRAAQIAYRRAETQT